MDFSQRRRVDIGQATNHTGRREQAAGPSVKAQRRPRQPGIFSALHRLDAGLDQAGRAEVARWVRDQYETQYGDIPLGFVARCFLGPPYVDHRLDLFQSILEHYAASDPMPEPFAQARMLARTGAYAFVEVYASGQIRPVRDDGSVVA